MKTKEMVRVDFDFEGKGKEKIMYLPPVPKGIFHAEENGQKEDLVTVVYLNQEEVMTRKEFFVSAMFRFKRSRSQEEIIVNWDTETGNIIKGQMELRKIGCLEKAQRIITQFAAAYCIQDLIYEERHCKVYDPENELKKVQKKYKVRPEDGAPRTVPVVGHFHTVPGGKKVYMGGYYRRETEKEQIKVLLNKDSDSEEIKSFNKGVERPEKTFSRTTQSEIILALLKEKKSYKRISELTGASMHCITKLAQDNGLTKRQCGYKPRGKDFDVDLVVKLIKEGCSYSSIAKEVGITRNKVSYIARVNGLAKTKTNYNV